MEPVDVTASRWGAARRVMVSVMALGASMIVAGGAPAGARADRAITFEGSCQLSGTVRFNPPLTGTPQDGRGNASLSGTCSGTLTDAHGRVRSVSGETVGYVAANEGLVSCELGHAAGTGYLAFGKRRLRFSYSEERAGPAFVLKLQGSNGGSGVGQGNADPSADPVAIAQACAGPGLTQAPVVGNLHTTSTISG